MPRVQYSSTVALPSRPQVQVQAQPSLSKAMALVSHIGKTASRILKSTFHSSKRMIFPEMERIAELLLRDVDLPRKDPDFFRVVSKSTFAKRFSTDLIEIQEVTGKYAEEESLRRYAIVLPLQVQAGSGDDVIPIPFILDTGAPDFIYICRTAVNRLAALNSIKEVTTSRFSHQVIGRLLGPGERFLDHPFACSLPSQYEIIEPHDPRLNLLGIKGMVQLGIRLCIQK